ncbi:MAG TPA: hypothetical protein VIP11_18125 [Gemmatimonadaceae bacterium]
MRAFLRTSLSSLLGSHLEQSDPAGSLTQFLFESNKFKNENATPGAFFPSRNAERERYERSVFRTEGMSESPIWQLAVEHVEPSRGKPAIARAIVPVEQVTRVIEGISMSFELDEPPPLHGVVVGWPDGDSQKQIRKLIAAEIASKAKVVQRPAP